MTKFAPTTIMLRNSKKFQFLTLFFFSNCFPFAGKTETLGSLYSYALLILLKSSKFKHQVVHEQKLKDLLSSTCQVSVERIVLDLKSEAAWVLIPLG